jgi:hypothetical protein
MIINIMTGLTITFNTKTLIERALISIRKFHPELPILIIDGSDKNNDCYKYLDGVKSSVTMVIHTDYNIGHGRGMDMGLRMINTEFALIFDSDIEMLKSPISGMLAMMHPDTFGCGWVYEVGEDGFDYGTPGRHQLKIVPYLHPYFQLINIANYKKFAPYCHHGAPCYKTMLDIYNKGLSKKILKHFNGLTGHTSGEGVNWIGKPSEYIRHDFGGTRIANKKAGLREIPGAWER